MRLEEILQIVSEETALFGAIVEEELLDRLEARKVASAPPPVVTVTNDVGVPSVTVAAPSVSVTNAVGVPSVEVVNHVHPAPVIHEVTNEVATPVVHVAAPSVTVHADAPDFTALVAVLTRIAEALEERNARHDHDIPACPPEAVKPKKRSYRITHDDGTQSTVEEV